MRDKIASRKMWSRISLIALVALQAYDVKADFADELLAAVPIHPSFQIPEVFVQVEDESKIDQVTNYTASFTGFADCSENKTDLKVGDYGVVTTPNYPRNYPGRTSCEWNFESPPNTRIEATIFDLNTQPWFFTYFDYVMFARDGNFSKVDRMAGDMNSRTPLTISSEANKLGIRFRSSQLFNFRGMKVQYLVKSADEKLDKLEVSPYDQICGQSTLLGSEISPGIPLPGFPSVTPPTIPEFVPTTAGPDSSTSSGIETDPNIIGPGVASYGSFPWMAALLIDGRSFCGGSLISDQYVLTAAHCTDGANKITLLLGALNIKAKKEEEPDRVIYNITRENIFQHPSYNPSTISHDITVIRLPEKVKFSENIKPICLPNKFFLSQTFVGEEVRVSGWGKPKDRAPGISPVLKNTTVSVMSNAQCRSFFRGLVTGNLICVGTKLNASPCRGDSGGPLIVKQQDDLGRPFFMQVGIVSFGGNSCQRAFPVGFTRVTAFLDYISTIMDKSL